MQIREIPFLRLGGLYEKDDVEIALTIMKKACEPSGDFFPLPEAKIFQDALARREGARYAVSCNSCGTALDMCMMALGIQEGDEVITTPLTFVCTAGTAVARGAKVIFADIDEATMNLDPEKVVEKITPRTKAIIPVHFTGLAANIRAFDEISGKYNIPIIYDAAHAIGTKYEHKPIGGRGNASCYSFQGNKNITCLGEGGAVLTNDPEFAEKVRRLSTFGYVYDKTLKVVSIGFNYRMTKMQLAVGINQLRKVERLREKKERRMLKMNELLKGIDGIIIPSGHGEEHGSHLYVMRLDTSKVSFSRDKFVSHLKEKFKVATAWHYPAVWSWDAFRDLGYTSAGCPIAAKVCEQVVTLPLFYRTSEDDLRYMAWAIKQAMTDLSCKAVPR